MSGEAAETLRLTRTLPAPPQDVWDAWTQAKPWAAWMCPNPIQSAKAELDLRVGGRWRLVMYGSSFEIDHTGEYVEVDPPRRLAFTWCTSATDGATTLVPIELDAEGQGATNLSLTHERLPHARALKDHRRGWEGCLALLDRHAAAPCAR